MGKVRRRRALSIFSWFLAGPSLFAAAARLLSRYWIFDVTGELATVWVWLSVLAGIFALLRRDWRLGSAAGLGVILHAWAIAAALSSTSDGKPPVPRRLRVMQANVLKLSDNAAQIEAEIKAHKPDVVCLYEFSSQHEAVIQRLAGQLPYHEKAPYRLGMSLVILSRHSVDTITLPGPARAHWRLNLDGKVLDIFSVHPPIPQSAAAWADRNRALTSIAREAAKVDGPCILIGDFNASPFARVFGEIEEDSGLRNSSRGRGLFTSWPAFGPTMIPLDHLFVSREIRVVGKSKGNRIGSDHVPIVTDLEF